MPGCANETGEKIFLSHSSLHKYPDCANKHSPKCAQCGGPHIAYDNKCPAYMEAKAAVAVSVQTGKSYRDALLSVREDATAQYNAKGVPSLPALPLAEAPGAERQSAETNTDRLPSLDNTLHTLAAEKCGAQPVTTEQDRQK